jgi:hypothetical protein
MKARPIRIEGDAAYVPLTKGYEAVIDAADAPLVGKFNWCVQVDRKTVYAQRNDYSGGKRRTVYLHRVIMGDPDGFQVDHRDGCGLNNRRTNLRIATPEQNQHNQRISRASTSGFKGVCWDKRSGKWRAKIKSGIKYHHLGYFTMPEAAHAAYAEASARLHGEFGRVA